ncbi:carrier protein ymc1 [Actinomortierella wolfii]|nr:carrier protein ymc1 [Actinomortierella wolfii]
MSNDSMRAVKDCVAGTVGGIVQVFVGQPFDTVKVELMVQSRRYPLWINLGGEEGTVRALIR